MPMTSCTFTLDGYPITVQSFKINRAAKINNYPLVNSNSDSLLPMGSQNPTVSMEIIAVTPKEFEDIMLLLAKSENTIIDFQCNSYDVHLLSATAKYVGGIVNVYTINLEYVMKTLE